MKQKPEINEKIDKKFMQDYRIVISAFLAGSGILLWVMSYIFNPENQMKQDIALIKQDISNINLNHEVHIQDIMEQIKDMKEQDKIMDDKLNTQQESIIRLLQINGR